jgi:hypothetical protein
MRDKFFVAANPTYGTAVAINADPGAIAATEGMLSIYNAATTSSNPNTIIVPQYIKLVNHVIGASGTNFTLKFSTDTANRYSSGGSTLTGNSTWAKTGLTRKTSGATIKFGDLTLAAATSEAQVGQVTIHWKTIAQSVGDIYLITFGDTATNSALVSAAAATAQTYHHSLQQVFLGRGASLICQPVSASAASTAATFLVEVGYLELKRSD